MSFQQFKQQMLAAVQQAEAQHQAVLARLSPAARQADLQLMAIAKHQGLTGGQKQAQIQQLLYCKPSQADFLNTTAFHKVAKDCR